MKEKITGIILAGGKSRRMGGVDKGLMPFLGETMINWVIQRLSSQVATVLINANSEIESYKTYGFPVIHDEISDFSGPLAGLHAGMKAANTEFVLSVPCDSPLLADDLATRLMQALMKDHANIAVAKTGSQHHPVFCLCRANLAEDLALYLKSGGRKVDEWQKKHAYIEVPFDDNSSAFLNINTPEELKDLESKI